MLAKVEGLFKKVFGSANDRTIRRLNPLVDRINGLEATMQACSDAELQAYTPRFKEMIENGAPLDDLLPEAYALVREVGVRRMGMRHYNVQLIGGIVLHQGKVAEMKTGEGKTLVGTLPVYLNALTGKGVHVVTVNDYLADRDADWMSPIYNFLGMSVGKILSGVRNDRVKRDAYAADITYGTNNEFGFDYLRDNMKFRAEDYVQRGHHYAIVDEVDSILIDEARTPLIISGPTDLSVDKYYFIDSLVPLLQKEIDYTVDEKARQVHLTDDGVDKIESKLGVDNLYDPHNIEILHHVNQALKAHTLFRRDHDYVVEEGKVVIVDPHTGRKMHGRRWSDGLHQAVEAKEKMKIEAESQTYATITFQNLFRMYEKLSGMTGTAETEAPELANIYDLEVVVIPTNVPIARRDENDIVYRTEEEKFRFVLQDIAESHERGQPVLVGTTSVEKSEIVARMLTRKGIPHEVLNAKNHARESHIISQAGRLGAVTIATNMAGRGTDIKLGGNPEEMAKDQFDPEQEPEAYAARVAELKAQCDEEKQKVLQAGGLRIVGTERHESRRIDNQLRGRSGRQGDPGSSKFYLSLEDDLLRIFGTDKMLNWMEKMGIEDDEPIEHRWITGAIENAQKKVEGHNFNIRKNLLEYDDVLNQQRKLVYEQRRKALMGDEDVVREMAIDAIEGVLDDMMDDFIQAGVHPEDWDISSLRERLGEIFGITWEESDDQVRDHARMELHTRVRDEAMALYEAKEEELGAESLRSIERMLILQFTDQYWKDHLLAMDRLRDGIGLRGYGQRNPLLEYKKEGFNMFMLMTALRDEAVVKRVLAVQLSPQAEAASRLSSKSMARQIAGGALEEKFARQAAASQGAPPSAGPQVGMTLPENFLAGAAAAAQAEAPAPPQPAPPPRRPEPGIEARRFAEEHGMRRNDPCPCGSGNKFKKCCMNATDNDDAEANA
ncbi:MAG: preprotein translocase subunit SecA [Alphaproteobacteria bacterium]|nr:preprotein translocase subunit SecA [Alphaproteobacteria bacterium]MCB9792563.1 preprotein translocase subunit SecA [Alphaproteobacteria bacterium]